MRLPYLNLVDGQTWIFSVEEMTGFDWDGV